MADAHKAFKSISFNILYFCRSKGERNIFRVKYFMFEDIHLYIQSPRKAHSKPERNVFFSHEFQVIKSAKVLSLLFYLDFLLLTDSQKQITYYQEITKNPLIAFKLICFYCSTQERADRGRKSGKSIMPLCLPPATIRRTPTLPLCSGLQELSSQDSRSDQRGHRHLTNHTSNQCKHHKAPQPIKQLLSLVLSSLPILPQLANQHMHGAERQTGSK